MTTSTAGVRIFSQEFAPTQISEILGHAPTRSRERYQGADSISGGSVKNKSYWQVDSGLDKQVPLEQKIVWAIHFVNSRRAQISDLLRRLTQIDLFCSLDADEIGRSEVITVDTIQAMKDLPIDFGVCFYHPVETTANTNEHRTWVSADLWATGTAGPLIASGLPDSESLQNHIDALVSYIETRESPLVDETIQCRFRSSSGCLGGLSLAVPLLQRLATASVTLQFQLGVS